VHNVRGHVPGKGIRRGGAGHSTVGAEQHH